MSAIADEKNLPLGREERVHLYNLVASKISRCDFVLRESNNQLHKDKAKRSKKVFAPIKRKLEGILE